jgi:uncharacterized membrane protein YphA (DoxX/SURF4 family)
MSQIQTISGNTAWSSNCKIAFRFVFIFFLLQIIPVDWKFYQQLFLIGRSQWHVVHLLYLTKYMPYFIGGETVLSGFANWLLIAVIAAIGAAFWTYKDNNKTSDYLDWYYWLRVVLRYRLAIGIIAYGLIKLFPLQIPYPSLSSLHTNYGDFLPWKIYYHTIGIIPWYESFLGGVEIAAGILLLYGRTATFGAGITAGFLLNIWAANFAYNMGEQVYASFLLLIAFFLVAHDVPRLYSLLIQQKFTIAEKYEPVFNGWLRRARPALKAAVVVLVVLIGYKSYSNYTTDPYLIPRAAGLSNAYGLYDVKTFKINHREIPYSLTDSARWQNVVFEKWATVSVKTAQPVQVDESYGDSVHANDIDRDYELAGTGARQYYNYIADTAKHTLLLQNKNLHYKGDQLLLQYSRPDSATIILTGVNEQKDSVYIQLSRVVKKYMLFEGRRKPLKI